MTRSALLSLLLAAAVGLGTAPSHADDCVDFKWDVSLERALFAGSATAVAAGADAKAAPTIQLNHLYELRLDAQDQVAFAVAPAKKNPRKDSHAGLVSFKLPSSGSYRIAIDMPFWIDVVQDGALVTATDFQGQSACSAPHKIVIFDLKGTRPFLLQLSNAAPDSVRLTVTATPARKL
jgi:hypothetical protein